MQHPMSVGKCHRVADAHEQPQPILQGSALPKMLIEPFAAHQFGITLTDVTNYLAAMRRSFRRLALSTLREMTCSEEEFRREAQSLMGIDP